jgi:hypothetical protein
LSSDVFKNVTCPDGVTVKKCPHGHGLFATKSFKKADLIGVISGGRITMKGSEASMLSLRLPGKVPMWWIAESDEVDWSTYLDHDNKPNARILFNGFKIESPEANVVALRDIEYDEEIFLNYHDYGDKLYKHERYYHAGRH